MLDKQKKTWHIPRSPHMLYSNTGVCVEKTAGIKHHLVCCLPNCLDWVSGLNSGCSWSNNGLDNLFLVIKIKCFIPRKKFLNKAWASKQNMTLDISCNSLPHMYCSGRCTGEDLCLHLDYRQCRHNSWSTAVEFNVKSTFNLHTS